MAKLELNNVTFKKIQNPQFNTSGKISSDKYVIDDQNNIIFNDPIINAIDIDWNNAEIEGVIGPINHTADLINEIGNIKETLNGAIKEEETSPYIKDGYWYINGERTDIPATGENGLTPYFVPNENGGGTWYIGTDQICTIEPSQSSDGLTPYIKDGYWWIGNDNTGVLAEGTSGVSGNTPYIGENGNWWIDGNDTGLNATPESGVPGSDGNSPYINEDGYWCIGDVNTGVRATSNSLSNDNLPYVGENGNWWIYDNNTESYKDSGIKAIDKSYEISGGDPNAIPIYDTETVTKLSNENKLPEKYIDIDISSEAPSTLNVIQNLMFVVTELQNEITRIKNTFKKGIYSYNNEATYMSETVAQYGDDEEPLWAIEEAELDEIDGFSFDIETQNSFTDETEKLKNCTQNRMFAYLTAPSSDVNVVFKDRASNHQYSINLSDYVDCEKCNILLVISRKPSNKDYPVNYIYTAITDYVNNKTLRSGYFTADGNISYKETPLDYNYYFYSISLSGSSKFEKFNIYVQDRTFGNEVIEATPDEDDGTYRVAHIAARRVKNTTVLKNIKDQLVNGEFIIDEEKEKLYLKINNKIISIGASSGDDDDINVDPDNPIIPDDPTIDTMENYEIIQALESQGLLTVEFINQSAITAEAKYAPENIKSYKINNIGSVKFVHEDTGKVYEYSTNAYGELESKLIENKTTLAEKLEGATMFSDFKSSRGFVGQLGWNICKKETGVEMSKSSDYGLYADRIKIGAIYGPLASDVTYGCSHAFIELENTSDIDFNLDGCQLHFIRKSLNNDFYIKSSLKLTGIIPKGGTYLIRGKKYIKNDNDSNCFIHVDHYDQEWYIDGELLDLTMDNTKVNDVNLYGAYALILSYHGKVKGMDNNNNVIYNDFLTEDDMLYKLGLDITESTLSSDESLQSYLGSKSRKGQLVICANNDSTNKIGSIVTVDSNDSAKSNAPLVYAKGLIDALAFNETIFGITSAFDGLRSNTICRGTYELDPAKQAFNSFTKRDSSRNRWEKKGNDYQYLVLNKEYIEFPKSPLTRNVNYYTPKASFEHKNVITDKTHFDKEKPNAVTVSYGENVYTTRCFNWLSASNTDEYVWIYKENGELVGKFESYKYVGNDNLYNNYLTEDNPSYPRRKEFPKDINNIVYCDYRTNDIIDRGSKGNKNKDVSYKKYATAPRACGLFAGSNDFFVSHKCIIEFNSTPVETKYSYVVGQSDKNGNPIEEHCSERRYFTLYPTSYKPVIYQITDQQGFHWIEYQVWAAAAQKLNLQIESEIALAKSNNEPIMPIILNTGDLTQSGARVNEWLDYFAAGDVLFNHFEQNNIVGNNDLNDTDIQLLGTGDDIGKSNPYYFYLFNCIEVNNFFNDDNGPHYPIVNNTYVPSLYYLDTVDFRIVCVNSEITSINCRDWYNLRYINDNIAHTINIYTGFTLNSGNNIYNEYVADTFNTVGFTPIYTLLWHAYNKSENGGKACITACHEMPFTVITNACCTETKQLERFRSESDAATSKLIGSHLNQLEASENGAGVYWFSRLLEYSDVKLCIGGHKHTYAISYPLREYYKYRYSDQDEQWKNSLTDGPMIMSSTLASEKNNILWKWKADAPSENRNKEYPWCKTSKKPNEKLYLEDSSTTKNINWSKLPISYRGKNEIESSLLSIDKFYPSTPVYYEKNNGAWTNEYASTGAGAYANKAVTYIMCQATGYKLTSNKELPTPNQKFSRIIPRTYNAVDGDTPDNNQKFPMYIKYELNTETVDSSKVCSCDIYLARATNIFDNKYKFTQINYNTSNLNGIAWHYLIDKDQFNSEEDLSFVKEVKAYDSDATKLGKAGFGNTVNKLIWKVSESKWYVVTTADGNEQETEYVPAEGETLHNLIYNSNNGWWELEGAAKDNEGNIINAKVYETSNENVIPYISKGYFYIDVSAQTGIDSSSVNSYDNYGIWLSKRKKMINTIIL